MGRKRKIREQTRCIDCWECPSCGHQNEPDADFDHDLQPDICECGQCGKLSLIWSSIEYLAKDYLKENEDE